MAGYYDPNKDYSKAISEAKAAGKDTSQLEAERQNKIDDKYGGKEPNMYGSNKTYSQASRDNDRNTISNAISISNSRNNQSSGSSMGTSAGGSVTAPSTTWQPGISTTGTRPDMSRHSEYAGMSVKQGNYTVTYDSLGYASKAVQDNGASANATMKTTHANDSIYHQEAYKAAQRGDWDAVGVAINKIAMAGGTDQYGNYDMADANRYMGELQNEFLYNARDYYNKRYDEVHGTGSSAVFDATGGAVKSYQDLVNALGADRAQQFLAEQGILTSGGQQYPGINAGGTVSGSINNGIPTGNNYGGSISGQFNTGEYVGNGYGSFEDFLKETGYDQYAEQTQAAIKAAVENAVKGYRDQIDTTNDDTAELARQAYITKMLGQKNLDQQLSANGYAGGMADSQRIAVETNYQNQLNELEKQRLATVKELESAITNAQMTGDMQTAQELSSYLQQIQGQWVNYVQNQQQMAQQDYWNQKQMDYNNYWNQQQMENDNYWNQQSMNAQNQENAYSRALKLLNAGFMPDDETLTAAGISRNEAQNFVNQLNGQTVQQAVQQAVRKATGGGYNNGSLTTSQVKQLQQALGVTADGLWGSNSSAAASGMTADQAWAAYQNQPKAANAGMNSSYFNAFMQSMVAQMSAGKMQAAQANIEANWEKLSESQKKQLIALTQRYS